MPILRAATLALVSSLLLAGCEKGQPESKASYGPHPVLPSPDKSLLPTANFSTAIPWPASAKPAAPTGFDVTRYASGLDHPRWIYLLPNGDVLVAESATVPKAPKSIMDRLQAWLERNNGSVMPSANRITLLRDSKSTGTVDLRTTFLSGLNQPFGMALIGNSFYVGNTDGVWRYPYRTGDTQIAAKGQKFSICPQAATTITGRAVFS